MTRSNVRASAFGALYMAGFGAAWAAGAAATASASWVRGVALACVVGITSALLLSAFALRRASRPVPGEDTPADPAGEKRMRGLYNLIVCGEGAAIAATIIVCLRAHQDVYITPLIAAIVGVHFLPLAALFKVRLYYATGALLILIPVATIGAVSATTMIGQASAWRVIPMAGSASVLWLTTIGVLLMGRAALGGRAPFMGVR